MPFTRNTVIVNNITNQPNQPIISATALKALFDQSDVDQKSFDNSVLLPELESTTDGDSGLDNIGMTQIGAYTNAQTMLEHLEADKTPLTGNHLGTWQGYSPVQSDPGIQAVVNQHTRQISNIAINVKDYGAIGDGVADDSTAIQSAMTIIQSVGGGTVIFEPGKSYKFKDVVLPNCSGWTINGNWSTVIPSTAASTCFKANYTTQIFNTALRNFNINGNVTDFIKFTLTSSGVLLNCQIHGIKSSSGTVTSLVTVNSTASGQGETLKVSDITILGADYDYIVRFLGASSGYGSCEFKHIFHNGNVGVATIYAESGLFLSTFDTLYHTRGTCVKIGTGFSAVHCKFKAMETESVEHGTKLYEGDFINCSFDVSAVYNQLLTAPYTEQICYGVFKNCTFQNNFVFQRTTYVMTFNTNSERSTVTDLQVGSNYLVYEAIFDNGIYNTFNNKQYTSPVVACTGAITTTTYFELQKNGRIVTLYIPKVQGVASATTFFSLGTSIATAGSDFLPIGQLQFPIVIINNASQSANPGDLVILTTGEIRIYASTDVSASFTAGQLAGTADSFSVSWIV